ncbi:MAG: response regulator [Deltaproteobacteria bacterium]|nr:response regulator [Deltaproteobacteria bacterium]
MGRKLLVADDSVTIQKVIKLALSSEGYDILAVSDGKEAIRAIQEERPEVVLIDVTLPGADAYEVKRVINANPKLASIGFILMLSAFERVDEKAIEETRFQGRLIKPFDPSHLRKAVSDLMSGKNAAGIAPAPPSATPPPPPVSAGENTLETVVTGDLPPMQDMHPTLPDEPAQEQMTEEEFHIDSPTEVTRTSLNLADLAPVPPPPPPAAPSDAAVNEERTDPNFSLPDEAVATRALENDIKDLTESTIKMSGLDEWSLDDSKKMKAPDAPAPTPVPPPASPPPPSAHGKDESTREITQPGFDKKAAVLRGLMTPSGRTFDDGGSTFPLGTAAPGSKPKAVRTPAPEAPRAAPPAPPAPTPTPTPPPTSISAPSAPPTIQVAPPAPVSSPSEQMTRAEIEQLVRKDLEAVIEKLAREAVPRIAEAIIRKELEKILAEP